MRLARRKPEGEILLRSCETHPWRGGEDNGILDSSQWRDLPRGKDFGQPFRVITAVSGRRLIPFTKHCQLMDMSGYGLAVQQRCSKLGHSIQAAGIHWNWIYIRVRPTRDRNEKSLGLFATGKQGSARCKYMYLAEFQERNTVNCETEFRPWFTEVVAGSDCSWNVLARITNVLVRWKADLVFQLTDNDGGNESLMILCGVDTVRLLESISTVVGYIKSAIRVAVHYIDKSQYLKWIIFKKSLNML